MEALSGQVNSMVCLGNCLEHLPLQRFKLPGWLGVEILPDLWLHKSVGEQIALFRVQLRIRFFQVTG
jgi:hypothetical protein